MSAVGNGQGSLHTLMMRSSTPASNEKVLLYLEGLNKNPPDDDMRSSLTTSDVLRSPRSKSKAASSVRQLEQLAGDDENGGEDIRSDVQEHASELGRTIPIHTTGIPDHEPGPGDPPGPKFESYGSSFGNFGPLPRESFNGRNGIASPSKAAAVPLPETTVGSPGSPTESHPNPFSQFGMAPVTTTGIAGAASYAGAPSGVGSRSRHATSAKASQKAPSVAENGVVSPKSASRALSPARTGTAAGAAPDRPWSPRTAASQNQSVKSRNTQKTQRTQYPPLPESVLDDGQRTNKAYSIAPSESASQIGTRRLRQQQQLLEQQQREREEEQRERELESQRQTARTPSHKPTKSVKSTTEVNGHYGSGGTGYAKSQSAARSQAPMSPRSQAMSVSRERSVAPTEGARSVAPPMSPARSRHTAHDPDTTPTPSRAATPENPLSAEEQRLVQSVLDVPRTRTSYALSAMAPSALEPEVQNSHFHDMELCQLLHALDQPMGEPVKKAVRKAVRARVKKLGMKYDNESIKAYRKSYHDHDPTVHLIPLLTGASSKRSGVGPAGQEPPEWAKELLQGFINMQNRIDALAPKIEKSLRSSRGGSYVTERANYSNGHQHYEGSEMDGGYEQSQMTQDIHQHQTGDESMYVSGEGEMIRDSTHLHTLPGSMHHHDGSMHGAIREEDIYEDEEEHHFADTDADTRGLDVDYGGQDRENSPGQQYLEQELYKLRIKPTGSQSVATHKTWELHRDDGGEYDEDADAQAAITESGLPEIPDGNTGGYTDRRGSPPLPPIPADTHVEMLPIDHGQVWQQNEYGSEPRMLPPWQRIHQRLLSWAIVWPMTELDNAVNSCSRGMQVDEIALSIWSTQTYKRYVRAKMTDSPPGRVDRLFVPPNMADAISTAVYNGRHGDACGMLRDLWAPFGLEGIPRLLIVLAKHRNDDNHWVVHRFSLPDGSLTTYDTYPERCLPDGRPLGWWFAIRIAWPDAIYPSPDHLMQKMVRLHRPMQLPIENSVAAAGIWRNLLMGSRAERSLDLERLRDLISTEVKNLRQRKIMGKLSIGAPRPNWEDMN
ncbi:hypothetical protein BD309DRAFT_996847 [Dichomitus squalens]|uniref:Uncharacterized protein n=1 Tax=Dichomitus squalens TaxID=114155 RepID=A0A4Q9N1R1_9APHY|nr:hypothetical protein BD311DRAFT_711845 [Dichomitus squalens]TBU49470.1 hypothetical protein BD309DRAFT_996847 [Dichomitus squalens]TBU55812.1 hypothetical protein BD310DRAFT_856027 [Dichomitus squalens]